MKSRVKQQEIADLLNVSRSTVTKVLNHDPTCRTSPETRDMILAAASKIGYQSRRRRTNNIAYLVFGQISATELELYLATCEIAAKVGYRVFLVSKSEYASYEEIKGAVNPLSADGVIMTGKCSKRTVLELADVMPLLLIDDRPGKVGVDKVCHDPKEAGKILTKLALDQGHTDIAVIVHSQDSPMWKEAINGYKIALEQSGHEFNTGLIWSKEGRIYSELLKEIMACTPCPTALMAWSVSDHPIALTTLRAMGYSVPDDLSYIAWALAGNSALRPFPEISCLDKLFSNWGRACVTRLLDRIEDRKLPVESVCVPVGIRNGQTCIPYYQKDKPE